MTTASRVWRSALTAKEHQMNTTWKVTLLASKAGSIGTKYCERRQYEIEAPTQEIAQDRARMKAYAEGLEHTLITRCE
jgi:hypothetical protein